MFGEGEWMYVASGLYVVAFLSSLKDAKGRAQTYSATLMVLGAALVASGVYISLRWQRLDHGPYVDLHETLASNVFGYHFAVWLAVLLIPRIRPILVVILPVLLVMVGWMVFVPARDSLLPVTYDTVWLPVHVLLGKAFIGCVLVATALGGVVLVRAAWKKLQSRALFADMPNDDALDELAFRFVLVGFIFETMMLVVGAIWAQDAWGRYWAWDPLETWSFMTWMVAAFYLHLRVTKRPRPTVSAGLVLVIFLVAFMTFFGVPFLSQAAHQGAV